jgi:hypothetical protein
MSKERQIVQEARDDDEILVESGIRTGSKEGKEVRDWMFVKLSLKKQRRDQGKVIV